MHIQINQYTGLNQYTGYGLQNQKSTNQNKSKPKQNFGFAERYSRSTSKKMLACFFGCTEHVATIPLENRRTVNAEWYTTIYLPEVRQNQEKQPKQNKTKTKFWFCRALGITFPLGKPRAWQPNLKHGFNCV